MLAMALERVADVFPTYWDRGSSAAELLRTRDLASQTDAADLCIRRFLDYEFDPGIATVGGGDGESSLGSACSIEGVDFEKLREVGETGIALGYGSMLLIEGAVDATFCADRDAEALWPYWVSHLRPSAPYAYGVPADFIGRVREMAERELPPAFRQLGVKIGITKRGRVRKRSGRLGIFGMTLRLAQTDTVPSEKLNESRASDEAHRWPFG